MMESAQPTRFALEGAITIDTTGRVNTSGAFCDLYTGTHPIAGKVALKRPRDSTYSNATMKLIESEAGVWIKLSHPRILKFLGLYRVDEVIYFVSPFAEFGSLPSYLHSFPDADRGRLVIEIAEGLAYLHQFEPGIVHGDVKAYNVLIASDHHARLCDFGLARHVNAGTATGLKGVGSTAWQSPEILRDGAHKSLQSDVYAFGITIYEVLSGKVPYYDRPSAGSIIAGVLFSGLRPPLDPPAAPNGTLYLRFWTEATRCWTDRPAERPSMTDVLQALSNSIVEPKTSIHQSSIQSAAQETAASLVRDGGPGSSPSSHHNPLHYTHQICLTTTPPKWLTTGQVSAHQLGVVYSILMEREAARQKASREDEIPPRLQQLEPKINSLKKLLKFGSGGPAFYSVSVASTPANRTRNRYSNIEPYDRNRVLVGPVNGESGRYLNASWVREVEGKAWWIATQLTPMIENGIRKADQYIPETPSSAPLFFYPESGRSDLPPIQVTLKSEEFVADADCVVRTVVLKQLTYPTPEVVEIKHVGYEGWPEQGIPTNTDELAHLVRVVQETNAAFTPNATPRPIVCHCSAGVGRTGTFIALTSLLRSSGLLPAVPEAAAEGFPLAHLFPLPNGSPLGPLPSSISDDPVAKEVDGLREQRTTMVQRSEQLGIIYQVLLNSVAAPC
ncbi:hypothetical protein FRC05_005900 [Tulasnella sp. 425]|nr:hypothetical protein FRC05_005900 [Tulasnella sp. 425]